ncbi:hypothetical protein FQN54_002474 [Arachnomyces sp. PD_36]|nr:hypothetical protein FQN54_002474 [Arachnomyces sp. PD_36]
MPSYLVTGAGRGLGYGLLKNLASNPDNIVFGLVRNAQAARDRLAVDGITNVHVVQVTSITDSTSLSQAAQEVETIVGDSGLDCLINNAAYVSEVTAYTSLSDVPSKESSDLFVEDLYKSFDVNVIGVLKTTFAFLPLIQKGKLKKVVAISSGMADIDLINEVKIPFSAPYAVSKAALSALVAKFHAAYADTGILFISLCPGLVDTAQRELSQKELQGIQEMAKLFAEYAPDFKGAFTADESAYNVLEAISRSSLKGGHGGTFLSHNGTRRWM